MPTWPRLGAGIGLRTPHYARVLEERPRVDWFEVVTENFMVAGGNPPRVLEAVRADYPLVLHGVSLGIGGTDPLDERYLSDLAALADRFEPAWVSDHLCWGGFGGRYGHDLWPLPYTEEALARVVERLERVQEALGRRLLLENVSSYVEFTESTMTEWEFLAEVARRADCGVLLDVNNVYVSSVNHGFDPRAYLAGVPADRVGQFHLAGHSTFDTHLLDTHDHPVCDAVWDLFDAAVARFGPAAALIEWDDHIPELEVLIAHADRARAAMGPAPEAASGAPGATGVDRPWR